MKKYQLLLDTFQSNAYPAMIEHLANQLGVTADSLTRLALGFVPVVRFKKGTNFDGWWAIPERDAEAEPVGLSLRHSSGAKVMFPGSHHGVIYEVNPNHIKGEHGYSAGARNWVRTMDAGISCPVCGKPDGCVVSAENPADPKAVICLRIKEGAKSPMKLGYLHIRKPEGDLKSASALADNGGPVIVVEGMSDAATAMDLGFNSLGRPSDKACMSIVCDLARGRKCIVVGENDKKADGREPGRDGMLEAFEMLRRVCPDVKWVMPPTHVKDLRAWKSKFGLTREEFLAYVETHGQGNIANEVIDDAQSLTIARAFLNDNYKMGNRYLLCRWDEHWYAYRGSKYVRLPKEVFTKPIYHWAQTKKIKSEDKQGNVTLRPVGADNKLISDVSNAMTAEVLVESKDIPCWINGANGPIKDLVVFENGILDTSQFTGPVDDALMELTPDLFTTAAIPVSYDPLATCPEWLKFIESSLGDDPDKIKLLQEWMGYCLTMDTSREKMMFLRGPSAAGKSKIMDVMQALIGDEHTAITTLRALSGTFGLAPLMGKLACFITDARTPKGADITQTLELLLNITSGDSVQVNAKHAQQIARHKLFCRVTIASNEFLDMPDHAGASLRRLNIIIFTKSFKNREDFGILDRVLKELPGIAIWALSGLWRLRQQGRFTVPHSSIQALRDWELNASPTASFLDELTVEDTEGYILKSELIEVWEAWSRNRGVAQVTHQRLVERVHMAAPYARSDVLLESNGNTFGIVRGLSWKPHVPKRYLGRP